jgi:hypothetical protein
VKAKILTYLQSRPVLFVQHATISAKQAADTVQYCKDNDIQFLYVKQSDGLVFSLFGGTLPWLVSGGAINTVEEGVALVNKHWPLDDSHVQAWMHCL